jgi:hypothetical protein
MTDVLHYLESSNEDIHGVHSGTKKLPVGTLVEIMADEDEVWFGEINGYNDVEPLVTYIEADEDNVYSFQYDTYEAPKEAVNRFIRLDKGKKREAWKLLGFVYMDRHEIISIDDMNSDESDEEWGPENDEEDEEDDNEDDGNSEEEEEEEEDDSEEEGEEVEDDEDDEDEEIQVEVPVKNRKVSDK